MRIATIAKVAVLGPDGQILLLKRSKTDPRRPGQWDYPGGGVDAHESPAEGAARELSEEAGITLEPQSLKLVYTATEAYVPRDESNIRFLYIVRIGQAAVEGIQLSDEHDEKKWVTLEQALVEFPHPFYAVGLRYAMDHDLLA